MRLQDVIGSVSGGESDIAMAALTITPNRMEEVDFTNSYAQGVQVIVTRKQ